MNKQQTPSIPTLKLYSAWYCPFAQRAWMALLHKGIDFEYVEVDPYRESPWWLDISRGRSLVPVVVTTPDGPGHPTTVIDSTRVVEYLDELVPDVKPLYPGDANARAELRFWGDHVNERVVPHMYGLLGAHEPGEYRDTSRSALLQGLEALGDAMSADGPFFSGAAMNAVDLLLAPFAYRVEVLLGHYRDLALPSDGTAWSRFHDWYAAVRDTPVFRGTLTDPHDYRERLVAHYLPYSRGDE